MSELEVRVLSDIDMNHESLLDGVQHLEHWLSKQPHLPDKTDAELLKAFIISSKSVERAKKRLDSYFTARSKYPDLFGNRDPRCIQWNQVQKAMILPELTPTDYNVLFMIASTAKEDVETFSFLERVKACLLMYDYEFKNRPFTSGTYVLIDCYNAGAEFLSKFVTSITQPTLNIMQKALPARIKGIICFNTTPLTEKFMNTVIRLFLSPKLSQRLHIFSGDHTACSAFVPVEMLPEDYGGKNPSVQHLLEERSKYLEKERDWFMTDGMQGADLSKRPSTDDFDSEQIHGTFRKLQID